MTVDQRAAKAAQRTIQKALRAASRKLPFRSESATEKMLDMAVGEDTVEAYRIGAEEAQGEIIARLRALERALTPPPEPPKQTINTDGAYAEF